MKVIKILFVVIGFVSTSALAEDVFIQKVQEVHISSQVGRGASVEIFSILEKSGTRTNDFEYRLENIVAQRNVDPPVTSAILSIKEQSSTVKIIQTMNGLGGTDASIKITGDVASDLMQAMKSAGLPVKSSGSNGLNRVTTVEGNWVVCESRPNSQHPKQLTYSCSIEVPPRE